MPANAKSISLLSLDALLVVLLVVLFLFTGSALLANPALSAGYPDQPHHTQNASKANALVRKLHFPDKSIGALLLIDERGGGGPWFTYTQGSQVGSAQGSVSVTVPPGHILLMDMNRRVFENPIVLKEVGGGLDAVRMSFMSMDDREDHMLERAVPFVENLKGLRGIFFDRSEINDVEVSKLKNLPQLYYLNFFLSHIDGSCFKHLSAFPELSQLDVPYCHLDQKTIADLAQIRKLRYLDLGRTDMTTVGARSLSKLTNLLHLNLAQNPKFDDECLKNVQPLTKLVWLDLRQTKVTFEGIKYLRGLKLYKLFVPASCRKNMREISAMFPSTAITVDTAYGAPTKEDKMMFGPLH